MAKTQQQHYVPHAQPEYETAPPAWTDDLDIEIFSMHEMSIEEQLAVLQRRPQDRARILKYLQETFGNGHVHEIVQRLDAPVATPTPAAAETAAAEAATGTMGDDLMNPFDEEPVRGNDTDLMNPYEDVRGNDTDLMNPFEDEPAPIVHEAEIQRNAEDTVKAIEELPPVEKPDPETTVIEMEEMVIVGDPARAAKAAEKERPAWVVGAEAYNDNHPRYVEEFNQNTGYTCVDPERGVPDVYKVAQWQVEAGLKPDGRVGPDTVDCSRIEIIEEPQIAAEPLPDNVC
jgi:hypothetical protein